MAAYGRSPYPRRYGGGPNVLIIEHMAMLDALAPGWDVSEDTAVYAETYAHALAVTMIWRINGRLRNQRVPTKMLESLPVWEETCGLRPTPSDTMPARRRSLAAKMRGFVGNTLGDIYDVCAAAAATNFVGINLVDPATTYWPGINPGPPGFEWSSNRATIGVGLTRTGLADSDFFALVQRLNALLSALVPSWMTFRVGTSEGGFIVDVGIVDVTLIGP